MARHSYLSCNKSAFWISDHFADASMLSLANFAEIEDAIHRASHLLRTLNGEDSAA
jgi:hypothetical protein